MDEMSTCGRLQLGLLRNRSKPIFPSVQAGDGMIRIREIPKSGLPWSCDRFASPLFEASSRSNRVYPGRD